MSNRTEQNTPEVFTITEYQIVQDIHRRSERGCIEASFLVAAMLGSGLLFAHVGTWGKLLIGAIWVSAFLLALLGLCQAAAAGDRHLEE